MSKIFVMVLSVICLTLSGCSTYGFLGENPECKKSSVLMTDLTQPEDSRHYALQSGDTC